MNKADNADADIAARLRPRRQPIDETVWPFHDGLAGLRRPSKDAGRNIEEGARIFDDGLNGLRSLSNDAGGNVDEGAGIFHDGLNGLRSPVKDAGGKMVEGAPIIFHDVLPCDVAGTDADQSGGRASWVVAFQRRTGP